MAAPEAAVPPDRRSGKRDFLTLVVAILLVSAAAVPMALDLTRLYDEQAFAITALGIVALVFSFSLLFDPRRRYGR